MNTTDLNVPSRLIQRYPRRRHKPALRVRGAELPTLDDLWLYDHYDKLLAVELELLALQAQEER